MSAVELKIDFDNVRPATKTIIECMGYGSNSNQELVLSNTEELIKESEKFAKVIGGYKLFEDNSIKIESGKLELIKISFHLDKIIAKQLTKCTSIAFIVVTLGKKYDDWINQYFKRGDPFQGYIADTIGSEMVENAADYIESLVENETKKIDLNSTNRYSPGYCGWNVSEQHKFFSLLPQKFCGIELSDSALMNPVKSVSAIIGIGKDCEKKDYQCSLCSMENCYKRNRQENINN
ncbi:MAG: methionine synthase [Calditrichia bacterium]|nr:methionine synthase [Calditrichia bacterium]